MTDFRTADSADDAFALGRDLAAKVPAAAHADFAAQADRTSVERFIADSNAGRIPELIPLRLQRMAVSPFAFYRGSAGLMAADLVAGPVTGLTAEICGDAHASNFGLYGTNEGKIIMDINDFDEVIEGPWEWDLKRLATSLVLAGREGSVPAKACRQAARDVVKSYRHTLDHLSELPFLEAWTALGDESTLSRVKADELFDDFEKAATKAMRNNSAKVAAKYTRREGEHWTFVPSPPELTAVPQDEEDAVIDALPAYVGTLRESRRNLITRYSVADVAFRIVGTGSVGLRNYLVLMEGNGEEALVLQVKEARPSALAPYLNAPTPKHEGKRIVRGARLIQSETDILLGWTTIGDRHFIVRQFRNRKGEIDPTTLSKSHLDDYGRFCGALLARAHSRSIDPRILSGYLRADGKAFDEAFADFAVTYANQVATDYAQFRELVAG